MVSVCMSAISRDKFCIASRDKKIMVKQYSLFSPPLKIENNFNVLYVVKTMTIKELWDKCIAGVKSEPIEPFSIAKGETIAIDISC